MGKIPSFSLPPVTSCRKNVPCSSKCYDKKAYQMHPQTRKAWGNNLVMMTGLSRGIVFIEICQYLRKHKPEFFRWHVSGGILDPEHFHSVVSIGITHPDTKFLLFTKQHDFVNDYKNEIPENLSVVFSAWPGMPLDNPKGFPVAWCQDGTEDRVPADALSCPGMCDSCGMCWSLRDIGKDVVFNLH